MRTEKIDLTFNLTHEYDFDLEARDLGLAQDKPSSFLIKCTNISKLLQ